MLKKSWKESKLIIKKTSKLMNILYIFMKSNREKQTKLDRKCQIQKKVTKKCI